MIDSRFLSQLVVLLLSIASTGCQSSPAALEEDVASTSESVRGGGTSSGKDTDTTKGKGKGRGGSAGVDGSAGVGGSAGTGAIGGSDDPFIRGDAPTESSVMRAGEYRVLSYGEAQGLRNGPDYGEAGGVAGGATVYYPADAEAPFGGVVIVPGFASQRSSIAAWGPFLASHGIVAMTIDTNTTNDSPELRSRALLDALSSLEAENKRAGSPLRDNLDTDRMGVIGWSMGGGGAWITADSHRELKVAISLCGWIVGPAGSRTTVPSLQFASDFDPLAANMSQPIYEAIPIQTPKMLIELAGGDHWIANDPAGADDQVGRYGLSWIKVFLEGDDRYMQFLETTPTGTTDFRTNL